MQSLLLPNRWIFATLLLLAAPAVAGCRPVEGPPQGPAAATATPAAPPIVATDTATAWQRIQKTGRLVVGTAADFPPLEYYNEAFQLDGYDPALLRAVGRQLGVEVVFKDISLQGLADALALGQIDVAAAGLTVTPARAALVEFSQPYFAASEGWLARTSKADSGADSAIIDLAGLGGQRIGVQRGSVYAGWLRSQLVDSGLTAAENLILYSDNDGAVADLAAGRLDLVVTDLPAAQKLAQSSGLRLAGQGVLAQQYALAVRKGADELLAQLNGALAALAQNGTAARIAGQQLGLDASQWLPPGDLPAAALPAAPPDAPVQAGCRDGMAWVMDLSLPDEGMAAPAVLPPGYAFSKTWRVLNTGDCSWDSSYQLVFAHGSSPAAGMGAQPAAIQGTVAPDATYDLQAQLVAPLSAGVYQGAWQLQNAAGSAFGERLRVGIQVAAAAPPAPAATQTPAPGIVFAADARRLQQGSPVHFTWDVQDAQAVYFYQAGQDWRKRRAAAKGSAADIPADTTTYFLRVVRNGEETVRSLLVEVEPNPHLPQINYFTLAPSGELALGECTTIRWQVGGDVEQVTIFRNREPLWEKAPLEALLTDCPPQLGAVEYAIGAQGAGGRNYAVATLQVVTPGADAATGAAAGLVSGPAIDLFSVLPETLPLGGCVELKWVVGGEVNSIRILRDDVVLMEDARRSGSGVDCPNQPGIRRYRLQASGGQGGTDEATAETAIETATGAASGAASGAAVATPTPTMTPAVTPAAQTSAQAGVSAAGEPVAGAYVLIAYRDATGALSSPLTGTSATLALGENGALRGSGGCNEFSSSYQLNGDKLTIAPIGATEKFCEQPIGLMDQEAQYLNVLQTAAAYSVETGQLTLMDGAGNPVAVFVAAS